MRIIKRKLFVYSCFLLTGVLIMFAALCLNLGIFPSKSAYAVGTGSENDPYLIASAEDLNAVRNNFGTTDKYFKLISDISLTGNWIPIPAFAAGCVFDGNGKAINNLTITSGSGNVGLFAKVNGGTIKDLTLNTVNITSGQNVGGIAGVVTGTVTCTNVCVKGGSIRNTSNRTGGFFGQISGAINLTIDKCCVDDVTMTATGNSTGGFLGLYETGSGTNNTINITNSYHIGNITGTSNIVGGIVGGLGSGPTCALKIENCFHIGNLIASGYMVGGILAYTNSSGSTANIINCFSSGTLNGNNATKTGGLYGGYDSGVTIVKIVNSYYDSTKYIVGTISGSAATSNVNKDSLSGGKTTAQIQEDNFVTILGDAYMFSPGGFPTLKAFGNTQSVTFNYNYSGAPDAVSIIKISESEITVDDIPEPLRIGYSFIEWNSQADGSGINYSYVAGKLIDNINVLAGQTLYAQWTSVSYVLSVDTEGAGSVSDLSNQNVTLENKNAMVTATPDAGGNFAYWQVRNKENTAWVTLNNYSGETLDISIILDEDFISLYAQSGNKIAFNAVFANTYTLTIKSDQQSYGSVEINGGHIDYNTPAKIVQGANVVLEALPKAHYKFAGFNYSINSLEQTNPNFAVTENIIVYATFEREEYVISSSSKYVTEQATPDNLITLSNTNVKVGDEIQISYKTSQTGLKFLSLNLINQDGSYYNLQTSNSGVYYLVITEDILNNYLMSNPEIVALYLEQYEFLINFNNQKINDYCEIEVFTESGAGRNYLNLGAAYYLDKDTEIIVNISYDETGYKNLTAAELISASGLDFIDGQLKFNLDSKMSIAIGLEALAFKVTLDAVDQLGNSIPEIIFNNEKEFTIEYNGKIDPIEKNDITNYRFVGWRIYDYQANGFEALDSLYINNSNNNLLAINYSFLSTKYISPDGEIKISAEYYPVFILRPKVTGYGSYIISVDGVAMNASSGQFDFGKEVKVEVKKSDYIKFSGFTLNNIPQIIDETDGKYILTFNLEMESTVSFEFTPIEQTIKIKEKLNNAKGTMNYKTTGTKNGDIVKAGLNDTITFAFDISSGYKLKEWKINGLTIDQLKSKEYATYNGSILTLELGEETLKWLSASNMELDISVNTQFNPLFTAAIAGGGAVIIGLMIFIALYMAASKKKKKTIEAAVQAGIIGSARFKSNLVEDAINAEADKNDIDGEINRKNYSDKK